MQRLAWTLMAQVKETRIDTPLQTPDPQPRPTFVIARNVPAIDSTKNSPESRPQGSNT